MNSKRKIGIIGAGSWGTALSLVLANNGYEMDLWIYEKDLFEIIKNKRENQFFLPGFKIPESINPVNSIKEATIDKEILLIVVPTSVIRSVLEQLNSFLNPNCLIINAGKGIENNSLLTIHQIIKEFTQSRHSIATLSGPTFAVEIAKQVPSAIVASSQNNNTAIKVQNLFSNSNFKVFTSTDLIGVELGGALKNVIAIATGISDGLNLGFNTRAALITRGLVEITRIGTALGAKPETFSGLSGMGDLVLTCTGDLSRNRRVGLKLAEGFKTDEIVKNMKMVAEGVKTAISAFALKEKLGIQASIIEETYRVIHENKSPLKALQDIMNVPITTEFSGVKGLE